MFDLQFKLKCKYNTFIFPFDYKTNLELKLSVNYVTYFCLFYAITMCCLISSFISQF